MKILILIFMNKTKIKQFSVTDDVFGFTCYFYIGDLETCSKLMEKNHGAETDDLDYSRGCHWLMYDEIIEKSYSIIWLKQFKRTTNDYGIAVHEITHLVDRVFQNRNILITADNTETRAYYIEFWFKKFLDKIK